jgi:WD40 repeat protein
MRIWEVDTGAHVDFVGHTAAVRAISFSPDGRIVATCSNDRTTRLWDAATGALRALHRHQNFVARVVFAPDGAEVAAAGWDNTLRIWPAEERAIVPSDAGKVGPWLDTLTSARIERGLVATTSQ